MFASHCLVAGMVCAQLAGANSEVIPSPIEDAPNPRPAASRIVGLTVYQGQALVTREVQVPEGNGVVELVVTPLPSTTVAGSLFTEGTEDIRVLSTRFRTRAVREDTRAEVRTIEDRIKKVEREAQRLEREATVQTEDLKYLGRLEEFTGKTLGSLSEQGRLDSEAIMNLSRFVMETRATKSLADVDLRQRILANGESIAFARRQLTDLASGSNRTERDAVIVVEKKRADAGVVRISHLVGSATWTPQYRLRGASGDGPVRLEYLAAVSQQTGESWPGVEVTVSTARPSLDAAPPELLPLRMDIPNVSQPKTLEALDDRSQRILAELDRPIDLPFQQETSLEEVVKYIRRATSGSTFPEGIPIYVDPVGLQDADKTMASQLVIDLKGIPLKTTLRLLLNQLNLIYEVKEGLVNITTYSLAHADEVAALEAAEARPDLDGGMGGMGGSMAINGLALEQAQAASGVATLNRAAAGVQASELQLGDDSLAASVKNDQTSPSVSFTMANSLAIPSGHDPRLLEVVRVELPADFYAEATPVLTPRVYRLARLTNTSDRVFLPGQATVYVGTEFVGRMKLPLVAVGEPFEAGFGVDPQLQVSRRLVRKTRTIQGGNQVFAYEFQINLRKYRPTPVQLQLWDRLPQPEAEAVVVNLVRTSADLSVDELYQRTGRADNLLRWDLAVPTGTTTAKPFSVTYEFRLEYARDLPQPRFLSGGLGESPIGGPAIRGAVGGFLSVPITKP